MAVAATVVTALVLANAQPILGTATGKTHPCKVPRLTGLTFAGARQRAVKAGCRIRLQGATVELATVQTIRRQNPGHGRRAQLVTLWVNPLCSGSGAWGPPQGEPFITPGATELIAGLYLDGGPHRFRSAPSCASISGTPGPGTITIANPTTGATLASQHVAEGHLATIPLPPATYTVTGLFEGATVNGEHPRSYPVKVTIPPGKTIRQDLVLNIP
jgi:hypothetical protein